MEKLYKIVKLTLENLTITEFLDKIFNLFEEDDLALRVKLYEITYGRDNIVYKVQKKSYPFANGINGELYLYLKNEAELAGAEDNFFSAVAGLISSFIEKDYYKNQNGKKHSVPEFVLNAELNRIADIMQRHEERCFSLLNHSPIGIAVVNQEMRYLRINKVLAEYNGFPVEYHIGKKVEDILPKFKEKLLPDIQSVFKDKKSITSTEFIGFFNNDGEEQHILLSLAPVTDKKGTVYEVIIFLIDVTILKKAEEIAAERDRRFKELSDLLPQVVFEADLTGNLQYVNKASLGHFGFTEEEFSHGINIFDHVVDEDKNRVKQAFAGILQNQPPTGRSYNMIKKDGSLFPALIFSTPIKKGFKMMGIRGILIDITEKEKVVQELIMAKSQAEEANRLKSSFLGVVSHEIRTPLNSIIGFNSILKDIYYDNASEEIKGFFSGISESAQRLLRTLNQVIDISRLEAREFTLNCTEINLQKIIEDAILSLFPLYIEKNIIVEKNFPHKPLLLFSDEYCVKTILSNIIGNALKYNKHDSSIFVTVKAGAGEVKIIVEDNGIGMSDEYIQHIFEPFSQESIDYNRKFEGSGLGLSIAKRMIEYLRGEINITSIKGKGTIVAVHLPLKNSEVNKPVQEEETANSVL